LFNRRAAYTGADWQAIPVARGQRLRSRDETAGGLSDFRTCPSATICPDYVDALFKLSRLGRRPEHSGRRNVMMPAEFVVTTARATPPSVIIAKGFFAVTPESVMQQIVVILSGINI
jgi:hypothetical protein